MNPSGVGAAAAGLAGRRRRFAFWMLLAASLLAAAVAWAVGGKPRRRLGVLGSAPDFTLLDQRGASFGTAALRGKVWTAGFMFTRCPVICPKLTRCMRDVQQRTARFGDDFQMVSFSVDPDTDTPPVLAGYMKEHGADSRNWSFLTGAPDQVRQTVVGGMKIAMGREGPQEDPNSIFHGTKLVLVDKKMKIRQYYECEDETERAALMRDIDHLVSGE